MQITHNILSRMRMESSVNRFFYWHFKRENSVSQDPLAYDPHLYDCHLRTIVSPPLSGLECGGQPYASMALVDLAGAEYAAATEGKEDVRRLEGGLCLFWHAVCECDLL